jgi:hypothetical protein
VDVPVSIQVHGGGHRDRAVGVGYGCQPWADRAAHGEQRARRVEEAALRSQSLGEPCAVGCAKWVTWAEAGGKACT